MEIEFHYFITKGIALRAGFNDEEAEIIAHASQLTDDNVRQYCINRGKTDEFKNYISFTYNILKPRKTLSHIYPIFHFIPQGDNSHISSKAAKCSFIPGDPDFPEAQRTDRRKSKFNTTPDSKNANRILKLAFETENLYRIGIALHAFADTWAHQNFTGLLDDFNAMPGLEESFIPNIGHADAGNKPEYVSYSWTDSRLKKEYQNIDNNQRFLGASKRIFEELCLFKGKTKDWFNKQWLSLKGDIAEAFGKPDQNQHLKQTRIQNYKKILGVDNRYTKESWLNETVKSGFPGNHTFKLNYAKSHWYLFQKEIIKHQDDSYKILQPLFEATEQKNEWTK